MVAIDDAAFDDQLAGRSRWSRAVLDGPSPDLSRPSKRAVEILDPS
jgi:hypothetical protein